VIFDCDGVLVDSERISNGVFCSMLNDLGLSLTVEDMFRHFVGLSMPQCVELITEMLGRPPSQDFVATLRERTEVALRAEVSAMPGVTEVLNIIQVRFAWHQAAITRRYGLPLGQQDC